MYLVYFSLLHVLHANHAYAKLSENHEKSLNFSFLDPSLPREL